MATAKAKPSLLYIDTPSHAHVVPTDVMEGSSDFRKKVTCFSPFSLFNAIFLISKANS